MKRTAFTLIELLIVVAIIAILAAIAVPNFLEAQTRSKVSRVKNDCRAIATAIEAYSVDWNGPPLGAYCYNPACGPCLPPEVQMATGPRNARAQALMTTPVAYIASLLWDPFRDGGSINLNTGVVDYDHGYYDFQTYVIPGQRSTVVAWQKTYSYGYTWSLESPGPFRNNAGNLNRLLWGVGPGAGANPMITVYPYDPSNGTVSMGFIVRTNKGIFTGTPKG